MARARAQSSASDVSPPTSKNDPPAPAEAFAAQEAPTKPAVPKLPARFELDARIAWETEGPLPAEDEARIDAARVRVLNFAKDQTLLDWLDAPIELATDSQGHGATRLFGVAPTPAGGGATGTEESSDSSAEQPSARPAGRDPTSLVLVTDNALATETERAAFDAASVVEHFLTNLSADTKLAYRSDLEQFALWSGAPSVDAAVARLLAEGPGAANAVALRWLGSMRDAGLSTATRRRRLAALKSVVKAARLLGAVQWAIEVKGPRVTSFKDTRGPGAEATQRIVEACSGELVGLRDCAMLLLAAGRGLRRREIAASKRAHVDYAGKRMLVEGKGEKSEFVTLPNETLDAIMRWREAWDLAHGEPGDGFLFRSLSNKTYGKPITRKGVYSAVVAAGKRVGIKVWTHGFRHTGITMVLDETGGNIRAGQQFARHTDPRVTMKYDDNRVDMAGDASSRITKKLTKKGEGDG